MCRFGRSGANLIFPLARTFVETVRMTALVLNWPFVVSISMRVRLHHSIVFTGVAKRIGRGDIALACCIRNSSVGAHETGEKILHLAFAGVAASDAYALTRWR